MANFDRSVKVSLASIAFFLGMIAVRPLVEPYTTVFAQPARFDHVFIASTVFLYKGQQGMLVMDRRNANVWFIPKVGEQFKDPIFVIRLPFDKLDHAPQ